MWYLRVYGKKQNQSWIKFIYFTFMVEVYNSFHLKEEQYYKRDWWMFKIARVLKLTYYSNLLLFCFQ